MSLLPNPLPDFDNFAYSIVLPPTQPKGSAWDKLRECERRLAMFKWADSINDPGWPRQRVFLWTGSGTLPNTPITWGRGP